MSISTVPTDPLILPYAGPSNAIDAADDVPADGRVFTFAPPPVGSQTAVAIAVFVTCGLGAVAVVALLVDAWHAQRRDFPFTVFWSGFALAFMSGVVAYNYRDLRRLRKFGNESVRFEIRDDKLLAWAPHQWGPEPRTLGLDEIRSIKAGSTADINRVRIFEIHVHRHRWFTAYWSIRVACADRGVMNRAIADLNAAVARAQALPDER